MEELRSEIRAAFEKEQAGHAPGNALRRDVVEAVTAQPRRKPNFQWLAVAAAVLLGILVVAGLMSTRLAHRPVGQAKPHASPVADYGPPPAGVPLLYVHDPNHPTWLIGYDWSAQPRGTVKLDPPAAVGMAPDGQTFTVGLGAKGGSGQFLDRLGKPIPGPAAAAGGPRWGDDSRHLCDVSLDQQTLEWRFTTQLPGAAARQVAVIARETTAGGQTGIRIESCSFRNDQAIFVRTTVAWPTEMWVVRVSDGKVLSHNLYSNSGLISNIVASRDSVFIAENSSKSGGQLGPTAPSTIIRRVSDGSVVATLTPDQGVLAFSGDDSLVLVTTAPWVGGRPIHLAVIDFQSGQVHSVYEGPLGLGSFLAQPAGPDFVIALKDPANDQDPLRDIEIFHGDMTSTQLPGRYATTW